MSMRDSTANDPRVAGPRASLADAARAVALPFLVTRGAVLAAGLLAAVFVGYTPEPGHPSAWRLDADPIHNMLARWDTFFYLDIATRGYSWNGNPHLGQNVVFFPLFPFLMRGVGRLAGGHLLLAGLLVSLAAFLLALMVFWRWTADRLGPDVATGAVWLLSAFPLAVFFSAAYTESLYLLLVVSACYFAERRRFGATAAAGFLGGLVRPNGLLLAMPIAWLTPVADRDRRRPLWRGAAIAAPALGLLCYCAYLGWRFGDPLAWLWGQAAWGTQPGQPALQPAASIDLWWLLDALSPAAIRSIGKDAQFERAPLRFGPPDGVGFFEALGWRARDVRSLLRAAVEYHRAPWFLRPFALFPDPNPRKLGSARWAAVIRLERRSTTPRG
jgi:hypothetical protein